MDSINNINGITIKELKNLVKDLPEQDDNGENYTVWISKGDGLSSVSKSIWTLNEGDLLIDSE
tara:strand:+ start:382 stop:570 length:189 start_codon:yes stop_codon:yes gene_type:complete